MAKVKQAPREDGDGAYAMATLCCPSADAPGPGIGADAVTGALVLEGGPGATEDVLVCAPGVSIGSKFRVPLV